MTWIEELEEKDTAARSKGSAASKVEGAEGAMVVAILGCLKKSYEFFHSRRGVKTAEVMQDFASRRDECIKEFEGEMLGQKMHESMQLMYMDKIKNVLDEGTVRLEKDITKLAEEHARVWRAELLAAALEDGEHLDREISPKFVVGPHATPQTWACLELGCGTGSSSVWLSAQGCRVACVDLIAAALRQASARSVLNGV
eukprot:CAMPEP_0114112118 /NCGR_PEP_ID=MMETSP0043_2-20121206/2218_1 /TAXON_ID=464988 /ORGANISM="Hemiselmis andersenii, Strain CCMP644" /LENGTH=198 /DNA_ID=CAMNT_0001204199 /DNA_START=3 /DNA_END=595 /DNA_ORIENTATION=+